MPKIIIAAGGTGGHLWPAVSVAQALTQLVADTEFLFVGAGRPVEAKILDPAGFSRVVLPSSGLKGRSLGAGVKALWQCGLAVRQSLKIIQDFKPDVFLGTGGYVTVPVGLAAKIKGVPILIHEQNSRPGLSNCVLARLAKTVFLGFEDAANSFPNGKTLFVGNPVRPEIAALHSRPVEEHIGSLRILVTGGSQGARALNRAAAPALALLAQAGHQLQVVHQAGDDDRQWVEDVYSQVGLKATVAGFFEDMASIYAATDLVICRAGALTLAELAAAGLPSILVPLPTAADDHQTVNARSLVGAGGALMLPEKDLTPESLAALTAGFLGNKDRLNLMRQAALKLACLGADLEMARVCQNYFKGKADVPKN